MGRWSFHPGWKNFLQQCPDVGGAPPQQTREGRVESAERLADSYEWLGGGRPVKMKREERRKKQVRGGQEGLQTRVQGDSCSSGDRADG